MKYLVFRKDSIKIDPNTRKPISSSMFPIEVECSYGTSPEDVVKMAFSKFGDGSYLGKHSYVVVSMVCAEIVSFVPRQNYDVEVKPYYT